MRLFFLLGLLGNLDADCPHDDTRDVIAFFVRQGQATVYGWPFSEPKVGATCTMSLWSLWSLCLVIFRFWQFDAICSWLSSCINWLSHLVSKLELELRMLRRHRSSRLDWKAFLKAFLRVSEVLSLLEPQPDAYLDLGTRITLQDNQAANCTRKSHETRYNQMYPRCTMSRIYPELFRCMMYLHCHLHVSVFDVLRIVEMRVQADFQWLSLRSLLWSTTGASIPGRREPGTVMHCATSQITIWDNLGHWRTMEEQCLE